MALKQPTRVFHYDQMQLEDPDPNMTVEQVRDHYANIYPELTNAEIEGPKYEGGNMIYEFDKAVGTKGGSVKIADIAAGKLRCKKIDAPSQDAFSLSSKFVGAMFGRRSESDMTMISAPSEILPLA